MTVSVSTCDRQNKLNLFLIVYILLILLIFLILWLLSVRIERFIASSMQDLDSILRVVKEIPYIIQFVNLMIGDAGTIVARTIATWLPGGRVVAIISQY